MAKNLLLTGLPGCGKTTIVLKVIEKFSGECGGFYTEEILEENRRVGFKLMTLEGENCLLAHKNFNSPFQVGKYKVNLDCIEKVGNQAIKNAIENKKIVVIDEVGKMELFSQTFRKAVLEALNSKCYVLATILYHSNPFCDRIKVRKDVEIFNVNSKNRNELPGIICPILMSFLTLAKK